MVGLDVDGKDLFSSELIKNGNRIKLSEGDVLHDIYDACSSLGVVVSGKLRLSFILSSGNEILIKEFRRGELFAELIVFTGENFPGWLIASEESEVIEVERSRVLDFLKTEDALLGFISGISSKMNHLAKKIEIISLKTVNRKIAYCLLKEGMMEISSVTQLASFLGCSREALSRGITELERAGAIIRNDTKLIPGNNELLESFFL